MKKTYRLGLVALLALAQVPASAAITDTGKRMDGSINFIYSQFTSGNQALLLTREWNDDESTCKYTILDKSLNVIKTFQTPQYPEVTATSTRYQAISGPIGVHETYRQEGMRWEGISAAEFEQMCNSEGYSRKQTVDGQTRYLPDAQWDYYYQEIFGMEYPNRFRVWDSAAQCGIEYAVEYGYDEWGNTGKYGEGQTSTESRRPRPVSLYPTSEQCGDMHSIYVTQTLFNTDEAYEWIVPILSTVSADYENEYERVTGQTLCSTGFRVMSENGSAVAEVTYPSGYYGTGYSDGYDLLMVDNKYYLSATVTNLSRTEEFEIIYEVTQGSSALNMVGAPIRIKVYPTAPHRGTPVEVELGETSGSRCTVAVVSVSGQTVMTRNIEPGSTRTSIDTAAMQPGVYVVTVTDARGTRNATKIAVR